MGRTCNECAYGQWSFEDLDKCLNCVLGSNWKPLEVSKRKGVIQCSKEENASILNDVVDAIGSLHSN